MSIRLTTRNSIAVLVLFASCNNKGEVKETVAQQNGIRYEVQRVRDESHTKKGVLWLKIKLSGEAGQSPIRNNTTYEAYTTLLDYYLNHAQEDIYLEACEQKISPVGYWFENNYNLVGFDMINVGFDVGEMDTICSGSGSVVFNDRNFKNGIIKLSY